MADDRKFLRELALKIANYQFGQETESPVPEDEKVTSNSSQGSGPSPTESVPEETQSPEAAADDDSDQLTGGSSDDAVNSRARKKRGIHSVAEAPVHSGSYSDDSVHSQKKRRTGESQTVAAAVDDQKEERARFLELVRGRIPAEDDPYNIHGSLVAILDAFQNGEMVKSHAHGKGCILLIGHGDLLQEFERLLNHDDELENLRSGVMNNFMRDIGEFLQDIRNLNVEVIKIRGLTADHRHRIEMLIEDPMERIVLVADLRKPDPSDALLRLQHKVFATDGILDRMKAFVSNYFGRDLDYDALLVGEGSSSGSGDTLPRGDTL